MGRSLAGKKRQQERRRAYKEGKKRKLQNGEGEHSGKDEGEPSSPVSAGQWDEMMRSLAEEFPKPAPFVDGGGMRRDREVDGDVHTMRRTELLGDCVTGVAEQWLSRPEVAKFMRNYLSASREEQELLELGIMERAKDLAFRLAAVLSEEGFGSVHTILEESIAPSSLRPRLLECMLRAVSPSTEKDDFGGILNPMHGAKVGLSCPMPEASPLWPRYQQHPRRRGEPETLISWEDSAWPSFKSDSKTMANLVDRKVEEEIESGRMVPMSRDEARERGAHMVTRLTGIWKDFPKCSKVRLISNYRSSGVNRLIQMDQTVQLPSYKDIHKVVASAEKDEKFLEFDIRSAYRSIVTNMQEQRYLVVTDPRSTANEGDVLWDLMLPFGLASSGAVFVRWNSGVFRLSRRLFPNRKSLLYIDDVTWRVGDAKEAVGLLLLPLVMGLQLEWSKVHILARETHILGYEAQARDVENKGGYLGIPREKREMVENQLKDIQERGRITRRELDTVVGKLGWCCQLLREHKKLLTPLYALQSVMNKKDLRVVDFRGAVGEAIKEFIQILSRPCRINACDFSERRWTAVTDGSLFGIGGAVTNGS